VNTDEAHATQNKVLTNQSILLIGGNRGLGLHLRQSLSAANQVHWTERPGPDESKDSLKLDLACGASRDAFLRAVHDLPLDVIFFNAAMTEFDSVLNVPLGGSFEFAVFQRAMTVNCYAPLQIAQSLILHGNLSARAKLLFMSSAAGSTTNRGSKEHHRPGGPAIYRISKSALNNGIKNLAFDVSDSELVLAAIDPGWLKTNKRSQTATDDPSRAALQIAALAASLTCTGSAKFLDVRGAIIPW